MEHIVLAKFVYICIDKSSWCRQNPKGHNCDKDKDEVITTEESCKLAAEELHLSYYGRIKEENSANYAAGCMWIQDGAFFNKIVDPSKTFPGRLLFSGGVCLNKGKCFNLYPLNIIYFDPMF